MELRELEEGGVIVVEIILIIDCFVRYRFFFIDEDWVKEYDLNI